MPFTLELISFGSDVEEFSLRDRLSGEQVITPNGTLCSHACDEDGNEKFVALDLLFKKEKEIRKRAFERLQSVLLGAEHRLILARRTLRNGQILAFERRPWDTNSVVVRYDLSLRHRAIVLNEVETAEAFGTGFLISFIDDNLLFVFQKDQITVGSLEGKKFKIIKSKKIDPPNLEIQQISWRDDSIHIIFNTPDSQGSTISTIPIRRPRSLLLAAHSSVLASNRQFALPPHGLPEPKFGSNPYRIHS